MKTASIPCRRGRRGFTLIELLVVISIISLLIAILLPALGAARTSANASASLSNVRQLMVAIHSYAADNKYSLPYGAFGTGTGPSTAKPYWGQVLFDMRYVSTYKIYWAPDRTAMDLTGLSSGQEGRFTGYGASHFGPMPLRTNTVTTGDGPLVPIKLGMRSAKDPSMGRDSQQLVLLEAMDPGLATLGDGTWSVAAGSSSTLPITRNGGVVQGYLDGHGSGSSSQVIGWTPTGMRSGSWNSGMLFTGENAAKAPWFLRYKQTYNLMY